MDTKKKHEALNTNVVTAKVGARGLRYETTRNGVCHVASELFGGWYITRFCALTQKPMARDNFFANLNEVAKNVGAFSVLPLFVKSGVFARSVAKQRLGIGS